MIKMFFIDLKSKHFKGSRERFFLYLKIFFKNKNLTFLFEQFGKTFYLRIFTKKINVRET